MKRQVATAPLVLRQHDFKFDRAARRMVCVDCDGVMGECPHSCPGLSAERRTRMAGQMTDILSAVLPVTEEK